MTRQRSVLRLAASGLAIAIAIPVISACSSSSNSSSAVPSSAATHAVVDMAGRTVVVPTTITRVATIGATPVLNGMLFLFHAQDTLVNANAKALTSFSQPFQEIFDPGISQLPTIETSPASINAEDVLALHPQVVLTTQPALVSPLTAAGLKVLYLEWTSEAGLEQAVTMMGQLLNDPSRVSQYIAYLHNVISTVETDLRGIAPASDPRVMAGEPTPLGEPAGAQIHWWGSIVGADDVDYAADGPRNTYFSVEQVLAWNPQYIITEQPGKDVTGFTTDSQYSGVAAVQDHQVIANPGGFNSWVDTTPETPLMILWMAKLLHPAATKNIDIQSSVQDFYKTFYGQTLTDSQISAILADNPGGSQ